MYFDTETQTRILRDFHFALRDDGFLFLGKSEALAAKTNLFAPLDTRRRVFAKIPRSGARQRHALPELPPLRLGSAPDSVIRDAGFDAVPVAQLVIDQDGILTLANLQARALFGLTQRDLGRPFKDLDVSFRPVELRSRIEQAANERHAVTLREVEWTTGSDVRFVDVQINPLVASTGESVGVGITFNDVTRYRRLQEALQESRREIETAYEELQSTVEELETTNEELQSTNEELETTNEELHASNEELETTNEELQSTNEELETINEELLVRGRELNEANSFLDAVLSSLDAGVVVVNGELEVEAWNRGARDLWGLAQEEAVGQHFLNLDIGLPVEKLRNPIRAALSGTDGGGPLHLDAVNRRGRAIECIVTLTPLDGPAGRHGVIVMMQPAETVDSR
jgi:two-component system CheB/CheR fusion protein